MHMYPAVIGIIAYIIQLVDRQKIRGTEKQALRLRRFGEYRPVSMGAMVKSRILYQYWGYSYLTIIRFPIWGGFHKSYTCFDPVACESGDEHP